MFENIVLHFFGKTGKYMETKPIHGSQKSKWLNPQTLEISLRLMVNYELERFILSYADTIKVIQPITLANKIYERLLSSARNY